MAKYLGELREERLKKHEVTHATHVAELARIKELALKKNSFSAAVNDWNKSRKSSRIIYRPKNNKNRGKLLEDLSEQELEQKMKKILDDYSQIINVTPDKDQEQLSLDKSDSPLTNHK